MVRFLDTTPTGANLWPLVRPELGEGASTETDSRERSGARGPREREAAPSPKNESVEGEVVAWRAQRAKIIK